MNHDFKNENANIFLSKLIDRFPNNKYDIQIVKIRSGSLISLEVLDFSYGKPLSILMTADFDEINIGH